MLAPTDYEIIEVENGAQELVAVVEERPDLILMRVYDATRNVAPRCAVETAARQSAFGHFESLNP
jgi:CheY-like chemotaxis protein